MFYGLNYSRTQGGEQPTTQYPMVFVLMGFPKCMAKMTQLSTAKMPGSRVLNLLSKA